MREIHGLARFLAVRLRRQRHAGDAVAQPRLTEWSLCDARCKRIVVVTFNNGGWLADVIRLVEGINAIADHRSLLRNCRCMERRF
jgi:hypothetical protein